MNSRLSSLFPWIALLLLSAHSLPAAAGAEEQPPRFYRALDYGSEAQFNPLSSFLVWSSDTLQLRKEFDDRDLSSRAGTVWRDLRNPPSAIRRAGGWKHFVNRQVLPVDFAHSGDSTEMVPNYALHLLGGGMVYRKNVEWFRGNGYGYPGAYAAISCLAAEVLQEVVEKKSTAPDDEVADVLLFRPAGMLLFSWQPFARFFGEEMGLIEWPYQPVFNTARGDLANVGENFAVRPRLFGAEGTRPFVFFGLTDLLGLSHELNQTDRLSWGLGGAFRSAARNHVELRTAAGVFYDRNDSLLASLLLNGTESLGVRLNLYPGSFSLHGWKPGLFLGVGDRGEVSFGFTVRGVPLGLAAALGG